MLSALDSRGNGLQVTPVARRPCGDPANHKHAHVSLPAKPEALRGGSNKSSSRQGCTEDSSADELASVSVDEAGEQPRTRSKSNLFSEQAKLLSDLFSHPWKVADCPVKEESACCRHQMGPKFGDWR